jgi:hypothetical protein
MRSGSTQARPMTDEPFDLDKHHGMAAQKATDLRRALAEVESNARNLRERQAPFESQLLSIPADSSPDAAAKGRYVLNLYAVGSRLRTAVIAISSQQYWEILRASPAAIERNALHLRPSKLFAGSPLEEAGQVTLTREYYDLVAANL